MMSFKEAVVSCFYKVTFSGRASRAEYWWYMLFYTIAVVGTVVVLFAFLRLVGGDNKMVVTLATTVYALAVLLLVIPGICVSIRRLHDVGLSGYYYLLNLIPYAGGIVMLILMLLPSKPEENEYGPAPQDKIEEDERQE